MVVFNKKIKDELISGLTLIVALCLSLIIANSPAQIFYEKITEIPIHIGIAEHTITKPAILWVNEGLMSIFFMLISIEIKHNIFIKKIIGKKMLATSAISAAGGIFVPIIIYLAFNHGNSLESNGWGIATTTDTATVLAILACLGNRITKNLKLFILMLSVIDDIIAIFIVAVFYTTSLSWVSILLAILGFLTLILFKLRKMPHLTPYLLVGLFIWLCVLQSGIHATLAGVAIGFTMPMPKTRKKNNFHRLEAYLKSWVYYFILPLFVFMNGGISFSFFDIANLCNNVSLGIILGLFIGKPIGVFSFFLLGILLKIGELPKNVNIKQMVALCFLSGIGFTMSLFLSVLAFNNTIYEDLSGQAVLIGSAMSLITGVILFLLLTPEKN